MLVRDLGLVQIEQYSVCTDCMIYIANGDLPEDIASEPERLQNMKYYSQELYSINCDECELGFSWSMCECCGTRLGGDRWLAEKLV